VVIHDHTESEKRGAAALDKMAAKANVSKPPVPQLTETNTPLAPPRMHEDGFPPLVDDISQAACAHSEAHPVAVAANVLAFFCSMIGRGIFQRIGDASIHCRPFLLIVGKSGKARKGTAETAVREIFRRADGILRRRLNNNDRLRIHAGGLSTGEGVAWAIRDAREADENGKGADAGIADKRLLVIESEMDNTLSQLRRDNNTLSATIRNLFDGRDMEPLTKTNQTKATRPHVVILGHITSHELREKSTATEVANGLLNRFGMLHVYRPKLVPLPEPTPEATLDRLAARVADAVLVATGGDLHGNNTREVRLSEAARKLWIEQYPRLTRDRDGKGGSLLARSEMYARMLAMIFAAMDGRLEIEPCDLLAAIAWVEYWHASVTYIFNCQDDEGGIDPFVAEVLTLITANPGITLSTLQDHWNRKRIKQVKHALEVLLNLAPPLAEERKDSTSGGRPALRYYAYTKG
jgi:putative DNA primase/helicase